MTRFQLMFRENGVDRVETRDNNVDGEPQIDGKLLVDGQVYVIMGVEWLLTADHIGDTKRFLCTPSPSPPRTDLSRRVGLPLVIPDTRAA